MGPAAGDQAEAPASEKVRSATNTGWHWGSAALTAALSDNGSSQRRSEETRVTYSPPSTVGQSFHCCPVTPPPSAWGPIVVPT